MFGIILLVHWLQEEYKLDHDKGKPTHPESNDTVMLDNAWHWDWIELHQRKEVTESREALTRENKTMGRLIIMVVIQPFPDFLHQYFVCVITDKIYKWNTLCGVSVNVILDLKNLTLWQSCKWCYLLIIKLIDCFDYWLIVLSQFWIKTWISASQMRIFAAFFSTPWKHYLISVKLVLSTDLILFSSWKNPKNKTWTLRQAKKIFWNVLN